MSLNISRAKPRTLPMRGILFGPVGSWKTTVLSYAPRPLFLDFHGSTATLATQPDCAWEPAQLGARPEFYPDLIDTLRALQEHRGEFDTVVFEGLDDMERLYLIPEALRRAGEETLGANYGKPGDVLLGLHKELLNVIEEVWLAGFNIWFTCHDQHVERLNDEGASYRATDLSVYYVSGKVAKVDCPKVWCDWVDFQIYLTTTGRKVVKGDKDKIGLSKGDMEQHVAYLRGEVWLDRCKGRRLEALQSPLAIQSPADFWRLLQSTWLDSYDVEKQRAIALKVVDDKAGGKVEARRERLSKMTSADEIRDFAARVRVAKE